MESSAAPYVGMLTAECAQVGLIIISKEVLSSGMPNFVFVCYSNLLASAVLLLFSFFLCRSGSPPLNFSILCWFFLLALAGCLAQMFGYAGINYSSPTLATAMLNLVPGLTFLLAVILSMEKLNWRNLTCVAKLVGTIVSIGGAFVATLYQGPPLVALEMPLDKRRFILLGEPSKWVLGGILLAFDCVLASCWVIIQTLILRKYPAELIVVFFYCFFVAIQSGVATFIFERDPSAWSLEPKLRLFAILYSGVFGSALQVSLTSWCLRRKGPVFVCMFKPIGIVIAVISGVAFSGNTLYLGSLLGIIIIVVGFYSVMWGKAKEETTRQMSSFHSTKQKVPLLGSNVEGESQAV